MHPMLYLPAALVAAYLTILGWRLWRRSRRIPHDTGAPCCRRCGYNLTGLTSDRCPECGADVTQPKARVIGSRRRAKWFKVIGLLLLIIGLPATLSLSLQCYRRFPWYRFVPTSWVFRNVEGSAVNWKIRGYMELQRRFDSGGLSREQTERLIRDALADQPRWDLPYTQAYPITLTFKILRDSDALTSAQWDQCLQQAHLLKLAIRPTVLPGRPVPACIYTMTRTPLETPQRGEILAARVDGQAVTFTAESWRNFLTSRPSTVSLHLPALPPGPHVLECDVRTGPSEFLRDPPGEVFLNEGVFDHTLRAEFEVLADVPPDYIKLTPSADLAASLPGMIDIPNMCVSTRSDEVHNRLIPTLLGRISINADLPMSLALDVVLRWDGGECVWTRRIYRKDEDNHYRWEHVEADIDPNLPVEFHVILRSSKDAALDNADLYEIWDGEVDLGVRRVENYDALRKIEETNQRIRSP